MQKDVALSRTHLLILALMNDDMSHKREKILETIVQMNINPYSMTSSEFNNFLSEIKGHGGYSVDGKCSVCLGIQENINDSTN